MVAVCKLTEVVEMKKKAKKMKPAPKKKKKAIEEGSQASSNKSGAAINAFQVSDIQR
jgi:hypothetical protein